MSLVIAGKRSTPGQAGHRSIWRTGSGGLLLPGAPRTASYSMAFTPLGVRPREPHVQRCRWHIWFGPISAVPCRAPNAPLPCPSILFAPAEHHPSDGGGAGVAAGSGTSILSTSVAP